MEKLMPRSQWKKKHGTFKGYYQYWKEWKEKKKKSESQEVQAEDEKIIEEPNEPEAEYIEEKKEMSDMGIREDAEKLLHNVTGSEPKREVPLEPPKPAERKFNEEVKSVLDACDKWQARIDTLQDDAVKSQNLDEMVLYLSNVVYRLEEIHIMFGNLRYVTGEMYKSYKNADKVTSIIEDYQAKQEQNRKCLDELRAKRNTINI